MTRSISALEERVLGIIFVHSEKGKLVVRIEAARSSRFGSDLEELLCTHFYPAQIASFINRGHVIEWPAFECSRKYELMYLNEVRL